MLREDALGSEMKERNAQVRRWYERDRWRRCSKIENKSRSNERREKRPYLNCAMLSIFPCPFCGH